MSEMPGITSGGVSLPRPFGSRDAGRRVTPGASEAISGRLEINVKDLCTYRYTDPSRYRELPEKPDKSGGVGGGRPRRAGDPRGPGSGVAVAA
jgi:hypothetical protein